MSGFIDWLEKLNQSDTKVRAVLRRSLAFEPGDFPAAYPFVEPFLKNEENPWRRQMYYLVAGLWAVHWRIDRGGPLLTLGKACATCAEKSASIERRFINLLDADPDQLPHRLRQMVTLLKDYPLDLDALLAGLLCWKNERKQTQNRWARDFYRTLNYETETELVAGKEENE